MSDRIKKMCDDFSRLNTDMYPDFVVNTEIRKRGISIGDLVPRIDRSWGDEYLRFDSGNSVAWDFEKSDQLGSLVKSDPRYELLDIKASGMGMLEDAVLKYRPSVTQDMLYNHFLVFDKLGYEMGGADSIIEKVIKPKEYEPHSYINHITEESVETKEEALEMIPDRISAMLSSSYIVTTPWFLADGQDLFGKIIKTFYQSRMK